MKKQYISKVVGAVLLLVFGVGGAIFFYTRQNPPGDNTLQPTLSSKKEVVTADAFVAKPLSVVKTDASETPGESDISELESNISESDTTVESFEASDTTEDASLQEFLALLDKFDAEQLAEIAESLDMKDGDGNSLAESLQESARESSEINPSVDVIELIESGVVNLAELIELVEASLDVMSEHGRGQYQSLLDELRTVHASGGGVMSASTPSGSKVLIIMASDVRSLVSDKDSTVHLNFTGGPELSPGTVVHISNIKLKGNEQLNEETQTPSLEELRSDSIEIKPEDIVK